MKINFSLKYSNRISLYSVVFGIQRFFLKSISFVENCSYFILEKSVMGFAAGLALHLLSLMRVGLGPGGSSTHSILAWFIIVFEN